MTEQNDTPSRPNPLETLTATFSDLTIDEARRFLAPVLCRYIRTHYPKLNDEYRFSSGSILQLIKDNKNQEAIDGKFPGAQQLHLDVTIVILALRFLGANVNVLDVRTQAVADFTSLRKRYDKPSRGQFVLGTSTEELLAADAARGAETTAMAVDVQNIVITFEGEDGKKQDLVIGRDEVLAMVTAIQQDTATATGPTNTDTLDTTDSTQGEQGEGEGNEDENKTSNTASTESITIKIPQSIFNEVYREMKDAVKKDHAERAAKAAENTTKSADPTDTDSDANAATDVVQTLKDIVELNKLLSSSD